MDAIFHYLFLLDLVAIAAQLASKLEGKEKDSVYYNYHIIIRYNHNMDAFNIVISCKESENVVYNTLTRNFSNDIKQPLEKSPEQQDINCFREIFNDAIQNDPQTVTILPTTNCNARCWYCYEHGIQHYDMTEDTADKAIFFLKNRFTNPELTVNWFGGEPLLCFNIIRYITRGLKQYGYQLSTCITTNGSLLNEQMIDFFKDNYEKITVNITVDGVKYDYANIKKYIDIPKDSAFDMVMHNIKLLIEKKIFVLLRINFDNIDKAKEIFAYLEDELCDSDKHCYHIYYAPIWKKNCDLEQYREEAVKYLQYIEDNLDVNVLANPYMDNILLNSIANPRRLGHCTALSKNKVVINADGKLYRCHSLACDEKYACGNVETGFDNAAIGYEVFEKKHEDFCGGCALLPLCSTQCRVRSILYGDETVCNNTKTIVPEIAKMKLRIRQSEKQNIQK